MARATTLNLNIQSLCDLLLHSPLESLLIGGESSNAYVRYEADLRLLIKSAIKSAPLGVMYVLGTYPI